MFGLFPGLIFLDGIIPLSVVFPIHVAVLAIFHGALRSVFVTRDQHGYASPVTGHG